MDFLVLLQAHLPALPQYVTVLLAYAVVAWVRPRTRRQVRILTELLPPKQLVVANGWIEGLTVTSIILGVLLGGALISPQISAVLLTVDLPHIDTGIDTPAEAAIVAIGFLYVVAATFNLFIPDTGARYRPQHTNPVLLLADFWSVSGPCGGTSWTDHLAVTTLFWGPARRSSSSC